VVDGDKVSKTTIQHIKHFLSGVFVFAKNRDDFDGSNPVTDVRLPKAHGKKDTYAYSIEEEIAMLDALKDDPRSLAAISLVSWSGISRSELEGLHWEDRQDGHLHIQRSVVEGDQKETKTEHRKAAVPTIPELEKVLDAYHGSIGNPDEGWMFPSENPDTPMRMNNLLQRNILNRLKQRGNRLARLACFFAAAWPPTYPSWVCPMMLSRRYSGMVRSVSRKATIARRATRKSKLP